MRETNRKKREKRKAAEQWSEKNSLGDACVETVHYWLYAPGARKTFIAKRLAYSIMGVKGPERV